MKPISGAFAACGKRQAAGLQRPSASALHRLNPNPYQLSIENHSCVFLTSYIGSHENGWFIHDCLGGSCEPGSSSTWHLACTTRRRHRQLHLVQARFHSDIDSGTALSSQLDLDVILQTN